MRRQQLGFTLIAIGLGLLIAALVVSGVLQGTVFNRNVELRQALLAAVAGILALVALAAGGAVLARLDRRLGRGGGRSKPYF